jgi:acyl carrier protein phosphodiesterase
MAAHQIAELRFVNYLAHILLAGPEPEAQLGGLLGDFAKAIDISEFGLPASREILVHRAIDSFTDSHPLVLAAKALFRAHTRRYSGILIDLVYDHFLAKNWSEYSHANFRDFIDGVYQSLMSTGAPLPDRLAKLIPVMVREDWLGSYREFGGVELAAHRLSRKLSKGGDRLTAGIEDLRAHYTELSHGFASFFPELQGAVLKMRLRLQSNINDEQFSD